MHWCGGHPHSTTWVHIENPEACTRRLENLSTRAASQVEKEAERLVKEASGPNKDAYPTTTYKNFMVNLPAAGAAAPLVKAFAPARSAKKCVLKVRDWSPALPCCRASLWRVPACLASCYVS